MFRNLLKHSKILRNIVKKNEQTVENCETFLNFLETFHLGTFGISGTLSQNLGKFSNIPKVFRKILKKFISENLKIRNTHST